MPDTRALAPAHLTRRLSVETPEHVVLEFELAGIGSRAAAAVLDALVVTGLLLLFAAAGELIAGLFHLSVFVGGWAAAVFVAAWFLFLWGYFVLFEFLANGRTPGKRSIGIRVVSDTGHAVTLSAAVVRNLVRMVDVQPAPAYLVGLLFVFFHTQNKRLGDIVAGTIVVRDRAEDLELAMPESAPGTEPMGAGAPELADDEFRLLEQVIQRLESLDGTIRQRLLADLEHRFAPRYPNRHRLREIFLTDLYEAEAARRRGVLGVGRKTASARAGADRFVALKRGAWEAFRVQATAVERTGLRRLSGEELTAFAAAYREVAADLARARTYGVDSRVLDYLARVVSAGHNALYGVRRSARLHVGNLLLKRLPGAVYRGRRYALVAFGTFALPAIAGYSLIRERPSIAYEIIPDGMIARAESGVRQSEAGRGYAEAPSPYLPMVASGIITNNVQVAFGAFAFGITAGLGTMLLLVFNGLFFGAVIGLFVNYGLGAWLLTFVAGHGVLELTAIFIAGGAGLRIARALVAPGDLARRDALVVGGRLAVEMLGAAAGLLVVAGMIEGFISASGLPATLKLTVSLATAVLLVLLTVQGRRVAREQSAV